MYKSISINKDSYWVIVILGKLTIAIFKKWMGFGHRYLQGLGMVTDIGYIKTVWE